MARTLSVPESRSFTTSRSCRSGGLGFGRAAMMAVESLVKEAGETEIGLTVFGFNEPARHLYDSLGYRVVATVMTKTIQSSLPGQ